jgi:hypothetical protein
MFRLPAAVLTSTVPLFPKTHDMKAPAIFALVVRLGGLVFIYQVIQNLIGLVNLVSVKYPAGTRLVIPYASILNLILLLCAAVWFLRGAPPLQSLAYPKWEEESPS